MGISFEKAMGVHEQALNFRVKRAEVLANDLANADTPGFKARDLDFKSVFKDTVNNSLAMTGTSAQHFAGATSNNTENLLYINPSQPSIDGNTVDTQREIATYTKNAMAFQASFRFLNGTVKGLMLAIKGN